MKGKYSPVEKRFSKMEVEFYQVIEAKLILFIVGFCAYFCVIIRLYSVCLQFTFFYYLILSF